MYYWHVELKFFRLFVVGRGGALSKAPREGFCLTLGKELSEEIRADKARDFMGKGHPGGEQQGWENPGELLCHVARSLGFYGDGISFQVVFGQSFWLRLLPGGACLVQPRWMPERILEGGRICGFSLRPFPNSSGWWWLISSLFLTRTSCHKTTHANCYQRSWPG